MKNVTPRRLRPFSLRRRPVLEWLEDRTAPSASWGNFGHDPQHTGIAPVATQPLDSIHWQAPMDLNPTGQDVHYGSPVITAANTVIVPVKTGANGGFELVAYNGTTGNQLWTLTSDYTLPPFRWMPPFGPALDPSGRLYFPGNGGTVYYVNNPDAPGATVSGQLAFYGIANYDANPGAYNSTVMIDTPLTADQAGNIYFGFEVTGSNPSNITNGGVGRLSATGKGTWVQADQAAGDSQVTKVPLAAAPALSADGSVLYVSLNNSSTSDYGYLLGLNSTSLTTRYKIFLLDPRNGKPASLTDQSTATPMVAPDGTVFYGVMGDPYNGSRGFMLHFSANLMTEYAPGAFGWDDTASLVPASMVPEYHGTSSFLIFTKYNNYVSGETGSTGGDGVNKVAILDPYDTQLDERNDGDPGLQVMNEVLTMAGPTPDTQWVNQGFPNAVREWCINDTVVDPATKGILINSEDGNVYRWDLASDTLTQAINISAGVGEPYTPTFSGPDGTVYAINGGNVFALGGLPAYTLTDVASTNPAPVGQNVTFTVTVAPTNGGPTPTGSILFSDGSTPLMTVNLVNGQATYSTSSLSVANHFITAAYSGGGPYAAGSTELVESVRYGSTEMLQSSADPSVYSQPVTLTATVSPVAPGTATPTGKVVFLDGSTLLGTAFLDGNGQATLTVSNLAVGDHALSVQYNGDVSYVPGSAGLTQTVTRDGTASVVMSSLNPSVFGQSVTFTATVTADSPGMGVPQGLVKFKDGSTVLASVSLVNGQAMFTTSTLAVGRHHIRAVYVGNARYVNSASSALVQVVTSSPLGPWVVSGGALPSPAWRGGDVPLAAVAQSTGESAPAPNDRGLRAPAPSVPGFKSAGIVSATRALPEPTPSLAAEQPLPLLDRLFASFVDEQG